MKSIDEIKAYIQLCREQGLTKMEVDGVMFHIAPQTQITHRPNEELKGEDLISPLSAFDEPDEDEVLYYSSPYYEEIQYQRELQKKREERDGKDN
jgi:hypothetical protein